MPVKVAKLATATTLGGIHVGALFVDEVQGWTDPFKRLSDYPQLIGFIFGLTTQGLDVFKPGTKAEMISDASLVASTPLLMRSVYEAARFYIGSPRKPAKEKTAGQWKLVKVGQAETAIGHK